MSRLQIQPHGLFPDISFGREPSHSTGGTFTQVAAGFSGAHLEKALEPQISEKHGLPSASRVQGTHPAGEL
jgi:hypothetical protein